eukprot:gene8436-5914_t
MIFFFGFSDVILRYYSAYNLLCFWVSSILLSLCSDRRSLRNAFSLSLSLHIYIGTLVSFFLRSAYILLLRSSILFFKNICFSS